MPVLNRGKTLLYMFLCTCRNMRVIFFTAAWHSRLLFSLWSTTVSRFFELQISFFVDLVPLWHLSFVLWTFLCIMAHFFFFFFFGELHLKYIKPPEACPQHHRGWPPLAAVYRCDRLILKSIIGTIAFAAKDTEQSQGHSSLLPSPSWSKLPFW